MQAWFRTTIQRIKRAVTQPFDELNRWQLAVRFAYDLGRFGARQLRFDRAPQMAGALAFRTLFGLLPVLIVATVLVKAMGMEEWFFEPLGKLFEIGGLDRIRVIPPAEVSTKVQTLDDWLKDRVRQAERIDLTAIGWVGSLVTMYAAISLMVTIENSFNTIFRAPQGRPWTRRVPLYWFILTLSPLMVILSTHLNGQFETWIATIQTWPWVSVSAGLLWSFLVAWIFIFLVYVLFPNTSVAVRPALIGAFVAAFLLEVGKRSLGAYLQNALSVSQLYGSLGLIPLFMFWVYLMWLVILFGMEVAATLQLLRGRQLAEVEQHRNLISNLDPTSVLGLMEIVAERFEQGMSITALELAETMSLSEQTVLEIVDRLVEGGFLHRLANQDQAVSLAQPPNQLAADRLIQVGFHMADEASSGRRSVLTDRLRQAQRELIAKTTLANLTSTRAQTPQP